MSTHGRTLGRRTVLRGALGGALVSLGIPRLDAMLSSDGKAYAAGTPLPRRFGLWGWGNGIHLSRFVPTATGPGYELTEMLAPFAPVKDYTSVVSGMGTRSTYTRAHATGHTQLITASPMTGPNDSTLTASRPSIDQLVAAEIGQTTALRSLEVGVDSSRPPEAGSVFRWWSHNGPSSPNPCIYSCREVFDRLFGGGGAGGAAATTVARRLRKSVLDAVLEDARDLDKVLGASDRARMAQHLAGVRAIEARLEALSAPLDGERPAVCKSPTAPDAAMVGRPEDYDIRGRAVNKAMAELVALALACDITRVFTFEQSMPGSHMIVSSLGISEFHIQTHSEWNSARMVSTLKLIMSELAVLISTLRNFKEGDGNLLDRCAIMASSDVSQGSTHVESDMPILVFGKAGGALRAGAHYRYKGENASMVPYTLARAVGVNLPVFGTGPARVTEPLRDMLAAV